MPGYVLRKPSLQVLRCALLAEGRALLLLVPSEQEAMLKALEAAKVPVKAIKMNPNKQQPITGALQALLSKDSALKVSHCPCSLMSLPLTCNAPACPPDRQFHRLQCVFYFLSFPSFSAPGCHV